MVMGIVYVLGPGGQYNHLIVRRIAELNQSARLRSMVTPISELQDGTCVIIGGGPGRIALGGPVSNNIEGILRKGSLPVLGICYGHQLIAHILGGKVVEARKPEFGPATLEVLVHDTLFEGLPEHFRVWMSHNDEVGMLPPRFVQLARSEDCEFQAMKDAQGGIYGIQFHVEVEHTEHGREILLNFITASRR